MIVAKLFLGILGATCIYCAGLSAGLKDEPGSKGAAVVLVAVGTFLLGLVGGVL